MGERYLHFKGLFGDRTFTFQPSSIHMEALEVRSAIFDYEISEHLHSDLTQLFFVEQGQGLIRSEGRTINFEAPCIAFVPNGVLHGFTFPEEIKGEVLTMTTLLFDRCLEGLPDISLHFQELRYLPFQENRSSFDELMGTRGRFHAELQERKTARGKIIELLLQILIVRLYRLVVEQSSWQIPSDNQMLGYYNRFIRLIKNYKTNALMVGDYAEKLNISPGHLNRICRTLVDKSALQVIHEQLVNEAKRLLLTTNLSISEISYELEFKEPSHFSKFFGRLTQKSPRVYRRSLR